MIEAKIFLSIVGLFFFSSLFRLKFSNQFRIYEKLFLILLIILFQYIIINPKLLFYVASPLKIERGKDLIFYIYLIISIWGFIRNHIRINLINQKLNKITSELALIKPYKSKKD